MNSSTPLHVVGGGHPAFAGNQVAMIPKSVDARSLLEQPGRVGRQHRGDLCFLQAAVPKVGGNERDVSESVAAVACQHSLEERVVAEQQLVRCPEADQRANSGDIGRLRRGR